MPLERPAPSRRGPARFLPPVLWMGVIALGSSSLLSGGRTGRWTLGLLSALAPWASAALLDTVHLGLRKLGHLVEFGILAVLWHRALAPAPRAVAAAFVLAAAYGGVDELRQGLDPSRVPAASDVVVDALGAWIALAAWTDSEGRRAGTLRVAAWGAGLLAALGVLEAALDAALGRPAGDVAVAALGLGLVAAGLTRVARRGALAGPPASGAPTIDSRGR
ncbi:MAG TPA: VanZ family protein [Methylomirabilota bacterium]